MERIKEVSCLEGHINNSYKERFYPCDMFKSLEDFSLYLLVDCLKSIEKDNNKEEKVCIDDILDYFNSKVNVSLNSEKVLKFYYSKESSLLVEALVDLNVCDEVIASNMLNHTLHYLIDSCINQYASEFLSDIPTSSTIKEIYSFLIDNYSLNLMYTSGKFEASMENIFY